jgi:type III pantothenate kinase
MSVLVVDIGNSRLKWGRVSGRGLTAIGAAPLDKTSQAPLAAMNDALGVERVDRIVAANVAGGAVAEALDSLAAARDAALQLVAPTATEFGVRCAYSDPKRLGADRWVAVIAAHRLIAGAAAVIDAGTTVTFDVVRDDGEHLGGLIMPGPELTAFALGAQTHGIGPTVPAQRHARGLDMLGASTNDAVANGAMLALAAGLDRAIADVTDALQTPLAVVLTGGLAAALEPWLDSAVSYRPHFVLEGLAEIAAIT